MDQQRVQTEGKAISVLGCVNRSTVVGGQWLLPVLACVTLNLLLDFHLSQFQEHIDRQEEGWVKATGMARPEVLLW